MFGNTFMGRSSRSRSDNKYIIALVLVLAAVITIGLLSAYGKKSSTATTEAEHKRDTLSVDLTDENFHKTIGKNFWVIEFYNPSCGACIGFIPTWTELTKQLNEDTKLNQVSAGKVDVIRYRDIGTLYKIQGFPTIKIFHNATDIATFNGALRTTLVLFAWVEKIYDERVGLQ